MNYPDFWVPENALIDEINKQVGHFPFFPETRQSLIDRVLVDLAHFRKVDVVNQPQLNAIVQNYKDTLAASNPGMDFSHFEVAAISSDDSSDDPHTFILPAFFKLDSKSKAKILIHEGIYRGRKNSLLKQVLQFETALSFFDEDSLKTVSDSNLLRERFINAQIALFNLGLISHGDFFVQTSAIAFSRVLDIYMFSGFDDFDNSLLDGLPFKKIFIKSSTDIPLRIDKKELMSSNIDVKIKVFLSNLSLNESKCAKLSKPSGRIHIFTRASNPNNVLMEIEDTMCIIPDMSKEKFVLPK
jgi:hypothetical protein